MLEKSPVFILNNEIKLSLYKYSRAPELCNLQEQTIKPAHIYIPASHASGEQSFCLPRVNRNAIPFMGSAWLKGFVPDIFYVFYILKWRGKPQVHVKNIYWLLENIQFLWRLIGIYCVWNISFYLFLTLNSTFTFLNTISNFIVHKVKCIKLGIRLHLC